MDNILPLIPAVLAAGLTVAKLRYGKPLSWPQVLAPLALYALPVILTLALTVGMLALLFKLPGMRLLFGVPLAGAGAVLAGVAVWVRSLVRALK